MIPSPALIAKLAPTGPLRAAINLGNPILAGLRDGQPYGVSVDLATALAQSLGIGLELVVVDAAGKSVEAVVGGSADVGFFAVDPTRAKDITFTAPYVLIEGCYLVRKDSPLRATVEVDQPGRTVVVGQGSAYDLFLTRELRQATIIRARTSPTVVDTFVEQGADVAAGVRQQLEADTRRYPGLRLLPERFMVIRQAMGLPRARDAEAVAFLGDFVEHMKASGFVSAALARHGIVGASVAEGAAH